MQRLSRPLDGPDDVHGLGTVDVELVDTRCVLEPVVEAQRSRRRPDGAAEQAQLTTAGQANVSRRGSVKVASGLQAGVCVASRDDRMARQTPSEATLPASHNHVRSAVYLGLG